MEMTFIGLMIAIEMIVYNHVSDAAALDARKVKLREPISHFLNALNALALSVALAAIGVHAAGVEEGYRHFVILMALILTYRWLIFDIKFNLARGRRPFQAADFNVKWPSAVTDRVAYFVLGKWYPLIMAAVKVLIITTLLALFHVKH